MLILEHFWGYSDVFSRKCAPGHILLVIYVSLQGYVFPSSYFFGNFFLCSCEVVTNNSKMFIICLSLLSHAYQSDLPLCSLCENYYEESI